MKPYFKINGYNLPYFDGKDFDIEYSLGDNYLDGASGRNPITGIVILETVNQTLNISINYNNIPIPNNVFKQIRDVIKNGNDEFLNIEIPTGLDNGISSLECYCGDLKWKKSHYDEKEDIIYFKNLTFTLITKGEF